MAEIDDTPTAPEESGQQEEPTTEPEVTEQAGVTEPEQPEQVNAPEQPAQMTADEIIRQAEERAFQRTASWMGRRDKDLMDNIGNLINSRLPQQPQQQAPAKEIDAAALLEKPAETLRQMGYVTAQDIPRILHETVASQTQAEQRYNAELVQKAAEMMDSDPLFTNRDLGNEVVNEITRNFNSVDRRLPPNVAAQLLVSGAITNIARKATLSKPNPLAGNKPISGPTGTIKPPVARQQKAKPIHLSAETAALAKRWNYSAEDLARVFGSDT